jgi:hypothetical protein
VKPPRTKIPPRINKLLRERELAKLSSHDAGIVLRRRGIPEDDIGLYFIGRAREALRA